MNHEPAEPQADGTLWTAEMLSGLDWRRLVELARALAATSGFELGKTKVPVSGAAEFMLSHPSSGSKQRSLFRMAPWNKWMAGTDCLRDFAGALLREIPAAHGIYLAPGGFTESAVLSARQHRIEMVDADTMARRLNDLPPEHGTFFHEIGLAGDAQTPSCPVCLQSLTLTAGTTDDEEDCDSLPDAIFKGHVIVGDLVRARRVEIQYRSEVQFLHEVRARDVIVNGVAMGDFHCNGLQLNPGAVLYGRVSARSVLVRDGAQLVGETMILDNLPTTASQPLGSLWRCKNPSADPRCFAVAFAPHQ